MTQVARVILACCLLSAVTIQMSSASAIPIWEFLSRNEKMSYLYSTFAQLVSVHCKSKVGGGLPVNQCKHNLLGYGYEKLQTFSDAQLEALDPYQRDANELIWSSIMRDHPSATLITTRKPQTVPTPPASSLIILTHQQPPQQNQQQQNPLFDGSSSGNIEHKHKYAMDMDMAYGYGGGEQSPAVQQSSELPVAAALTAEPPQRYLSGPLVIRLRPDGTPVEEDKKRPLPRDDDLETYRLAHGGNIGSNSNPRPNRHRKIATISALKQQHFAAISAERELQPPHPQQVRRQFRQTQPLQQQQLQLQTQSHPQPLISSGYYYSKGQA
ncbi:LOW QUALITY PROTEIN: rhythmically expressed gene 5 protein [Drosophila nasuta]|uniref:LOW QUALITY PROTEIN: rhythmically expressed gene 5 protein n=1 Tax=Drosophila nasuta TaxID=42062 RepID=UPI00295F43F5|nr:LOW QUALITY PROTEIN: rhythmically expressed gene 5 protein [Drosophila nasuta]